MNRQEAVLRELGLYPLWQRREMPLVLNAQNVPAVEANLFARGEAANQTVDAPFILPIVEGQGASTNNEKRANEFAPTSVASMVERTVADAVEISPTKITSEIRSDWSELHPQIATCQRCELHAGCLQTVCGTGDPAADWLFVGDWSSEEDDVQGEPFMGAAGKLLDNMLRAMGLNRQQNVYLSNVLKCRPPEQHHSLSREIAQCLPYLHQQIELIKPKKIIALGNTAAHALLSCNAPLKTLRGQVHHYQAIPVIVTYHPAYLLRSPLDKAQLWADLCLAKTLD